MYNHILKSTAYAIKIILFLKEETYLVESQEIITSVDQK